MTIIYNKIDKIPQKATITHDDGYCKIYLSAKSGNGLELLREHLKQAAGVQSGFEGVFSARRRHLDALSIAYDALLQAKSQLIDFNAGELMAQELLLARNALASITGQFSADDLLGEIFSSFCIGK